MVKWQSIWSIFSSKSPANGRVDEGVGPCFMCCLHANVSSMSDNYGNVNFDIAKLKGGKALKSDDNISVI